MENYIWLFGENLGRTANNNSFYMWKYIINNEAYPHLKSYIILEKNDDNRKVFREMNEMEKKYVIWRNSIKHLKLFFQADMFFVSLSFRDIQPDRIGFKSFKPLLTRPLVYLQHGVCAIKQLGYKPNYANNCLFKFIYYNPYMKEKFQSINEFKEYQLYDGIVQPRYMEMVKRAKETTFTSNRGVRILWFLTWREYFGNNFETYNFIKKIESIVKNRKITEFLKDKDNLLTICLHDKFNVEQERILKNSVKDSNIQFVTPQSIDVMQAIVDHDVLITDYSSIAFEFTFLRKPVILYQPDFEAYLSKRNLYCEISELRKYSITRKELLIDIITSNRFSINDFFLKRIRKIDYNDVIRGIYIKKMSDYFYEKTRNAICFLGYDFSGIGGTVFATRALAEGLREKDYLVRFLTLKKVTGRNYPAGVPNQPVYNRFKPKLSDKLLVALVRGNWFYSYLKNDPAYKALQPIAGIGMKKYLKSIHVNTIISTRESLHFFLHDLKSDLVKNKIYFFHTSANVVDALYPGAISSLNKMNLSNVLFVTEKNRESLRKIYNFKNYKNYEVLGNCLDSTRMIEESEIVPIEENNVYRCAYLLRISEERRKDLIRLLEFGEFLKENKIENIIVNIYGDGELVCWLIDEIYSRDLDDCLYYQGKTNDIKATFKINDLAIDFSYSQSFGMPYIEGILNGKMVYCFENEGSKEVLSRIPLCIVHNFDELVERIENSNQITVKQLQDNYDMIQARYSRKKVTEKFLEFLGRC